MVRSFSLAALSLGATLAAVPAQDRTPDSRPPTALETMLAQYVCDLPSSTGPVDDSAREQCTGAQRQTLRAEFGYDLSRLSIAERGKVDAACSHLRAKVEVEPYLKCLAYGLASIRPGWAPEQLTQLSLAPAIPVATPKPNTATTPRRSSVFAPVLAGAALAVVGVAAVVVMTRRRRPARLCRECGTAAEGTGDLCPDCRHRAAAALKQANIDRAENELAEQNAQCRRQAEEDERQRQEEEREARRLQAEAARQAAEAQARSRPLVVLGTPDDDGF
jgi:hypothetical protein